MKTSFLKITKYLNSSLNQEQDELAKEGFVNIYINQKLIQCLNCSPGLEEELALGFSYCNCLITSYNELQEARIQSQGPRAIRVDLTLNKNHNLPSGYSLPCPGPKSALSTGKRQRIKQIQGLSIEKIFLLKEKHEKNLDLFPKTGCAHSAAFFSYSFKQLSFAEDITRRNALYKGIGELVKNNTMPKAYLASLSSRINHDLLISAASTPIEILAGESAATDLAAQYADELNLTLIGFLRKKRFNIYTHPHRILNNGSENST